MSKLLKNSAIYIYNALPDSFLNGKKRLEKKDLKKDWETLSKHLGMVSKIEHELEYEYEEEIEDELEEEEIIAKNNLIDSGLLKPFKEDVLYPIEDLKKHYKTLEIFHHLNFRIDSPF